MRHRKGGRKLGRTSAHRKAMFRNLVTSLLDRERVRTTDAKAKEVRRLADRMITLGKRGDLHARRRALTVIRSRSVTSKLFSDIAERFRDRPGGYTRVIKIGNRVGDAAPQSIVELVEGEAAPRKASESGKKTASTKKGASKKKATASSKKPAAAKTPKAAAAKKSAASKKAATKKPAAPRKASASKKSGRTKSS